MRAVSGGRDAASGLSCARREPSIPFAPSRSRQTSSPGFRQSAQPSGSAVPASPCRHLPSRLAGPTARMPEQPARELPDGDQPARLSTAASPGAGQRSQPGWPRCTRAPHSTSSRHRIAGEHARQFPAWQARLASTSPRNRPRGVRRRADRLSRERHNAQAFAAGACLSGPTACGAIDPRAPPLPVFLRIAVVRHRRTSPVRRRMRRPKAPREAIRCARRGVRRRFRSPSRE